MFCSSSDQVPPSFREDADSLARAMAREGIALVYGGGSVGLMGVLADRILEEGGEVIGVIPRFLRTKELAHEGVSRMIVTETMHERKAQMSRLSDAFAVLPGGFGTLDEFFEILTWRQLGIHDRPIVVADTGGWFTPLLDFLQRATEFRTVSEAHLGLFEVVPAGIDVLPALLRKRPGERRRGHLGRV